MAGARVSAIGIDLGTTNSCAAVVMNGSVKVIWNNSGQNLTPSCVGFNEDERLVGEKAKLQAIYNPKNTIFDAKRLIGRKFDDPGVTKRIHHWPFQVINARGNPKFRVEYRREVKEYTPEEVSAFVLVEIKRLAQKVVGSEIRDAVITVPAYFNDSQRQATLDAGKIAGLNVLKLLNEPTAAALAYGFDQKKAQENVLVYDLGGGTLDVAILSIADNNFEVLAVDGDTFLGGSDLDQCLVSHFIEDIEKKYGQDLSDSPKALCKLKFACETAKKNLSSSSMSDVVVDTLLSGTEKDFKSKLSRAKLNRLFDGYFTAAMKPVSAVLKAAKLNAKDIDEVVLAGGSTRIPKIKELLKTMLNKTRLNETINPDEAVAYGAALHAAALTKNETVEDIKLADVTPQSLGINVLGGLMSKVIPRNTKIPAKKTRRFVTTVDDQTGVDIKVYEGERPNSDENNLLGEFALENIRTARKGVQQIAVTFSIDLNGILTVSAVDRSTGINEQLVIKMNKGRLKQSEIERMVVEANDYEESENKRELRESARNKLETMCDDLLDDLSNQEYDDEEGTDLDDALNICYDVRDWLDGNYEATEDEYRSRLRSLEQLKARQLSI